MAHLTVERNGKTICLRSQAFCGEFNETVDTKKALFVFLRLLSCPKTGKPLFTLQKLADAFGKNDRRDIDNFVREFWKRGGDFLAYLARKRPKQERLFPVIECQILATPLLSLAEQYRIFCETHPQERICEQSFRSYVNDIAATKILKRVRELGFKKEWLSLAPLASKLLVVIVYVCGLSQEMLALLFGVSKTSIHNWIYTVCSAALYWEIIRNIVHWSGQVSFDEKWVKMNGVWHFVLCAVDAVSGFPLLIDLYPTLDTLSWTLFFERFTTLYGVPKLIQCDGSQSLAAARKAVFPGVRYQLCQFHKLKNLMKRLRHHIRDPKLIKRCIRLAKHSFSNSSVSSRKHAAQTLQELAGPQVSSSIDEHLLKYWRNLTLSLTNNASERFNRKIEKCVFGRYGIASVESAQVLLRGLWLKELLLNGHQHMAANCELRTINLSRICQEHLDTSKILHFFYDYDLSQTEKLA
jgi:transposase-like protein